MSRPTPETDAEVIICHGIPDGFNPPERSYTSSKFARRLERERDEAREENAKLVSIAERAIDDLRWFYESKADGIILELDQLKEGAK